MVQRVLSAFFSLKSIRVLVAVALIAVATVLFLFQAVFLADTLVLIFLGRDLTADHLRVLEPLVQGVLVYVVLGLLAFFGASVAVRGVPREHVFTGALIGLLGAFGAQGLLLQFPGDSVYEATAYAAVGVVCGAFGGMRGLDTRTRGASREHMSGKIALAQTPQAVTQAVGEHLALVGARAVYAWRVEDDPKPGEAERSAGTLDPALKEWASWRDREWLGELSPPPVPLHAIPAPDTGPMDLRSIGAGEPGGGEPARTPHRRTDTTLYAALTDRSGRPIGVLAAAFCKPFSDFVRRGAEHREFAATAQQANVALGGMRLAAENQLLGERLERERFRGELHNSALQHLNLARMDLRRLTDRTADGGGAPTEEELAEGLRQVFGNVSEASGEMRRLVRGGRPKPLESGSSLAKTLAGMARDVSEQCPVRAESEVTGPVRPLPPGVEDQLYWAAREAFNNVVKHSRANRAKATLTYLEDAVVLDVIDDGAGLPSQAAREDRPAGEDGGDGLRLLREQVERYGGRLHLGERPGGGTVFTARFDHPAT